MAFSSTVTFTNNSYLSSYPSLSNKESFNAREIHGKTLALFLLNKSSINKAVINITELNKKMATAHQQINGASTPQTTNAEAFRKEYTDLQPIYYKSLALIELVEKHLTQFNNIPLLTEKQKETLQWISPECAEAFFSAYAYRDNIANGLVEDKNYQSYTQMHKALKETAKTLQEKFTQAKDYLVTLESPQSYGFTKFLTRKSWDISKAVKGTATSLLGNQRKDIKDKWLDLNPYVFFSKQFATEKKKAIVQCSAQKEHEDIAKTWESLAKTLKKIPEELNTLESRLNTELTIIQNNPSKYEKNWLSSRYQEIETHEKTAKEVTIHKKSYFDKREKFSYNSS